MSIFSGLEHITSENYSLARHTWYGLGGPADYFLRPENIEQLAEVIKRCGEKNIPIYVLGAGSNLLVADKGIRGAVVKLESEAFTGVEYDGETITAGAGAEINKIVLNCTQKGLSGLEALTGIPGTVGGVVRMNAGGRFGDIGAVVESVTLMDNQAGVFERAKPDLMFDYRTTNITAKFILGAKLQLNQADPEQILRTVQEIWIYKKNNQPLSTKNSGCIFKNPPGPNSAGALIDRAGLKGMQVGGAIVSEKHANFIVAAKGCTSKDVLSLIEIIKEKVKEKFDTELELEIEIWK